MNLNVHLSILGHKASDRVSGLEGIVTSVSFDLYGCIQGLIHPGLDKDGKLEDQCWIDLNRLEIIGDQTVMAQPDFVQGPAIEGKKGPAEKPLPSQP